MTEQVRITIDLEGTVGTALRLRAARDGVSPPELVVEILRKALGSELTEAAGRRPLAAMISEACRAAASRPVSPRRAASSSPSK